MTQTQKGSNERLFIYYDTDTQYANFSGNFPSSSQKTTLKTTVKRLKTMKNEKETVLFLVDLLSLVGRS